MVVFFHADAAFDVRGKKTNRDIKPHYTLIKENKMTQWIGSAREKHEDAMENSNTIRTVLGVCVCVCIRFFFIWNKKESWQKKKKRKKQYETVSNVSLDCIRFVLLISLTRFPSHSLLLVGCQDSQKAAVCPVYASQISPVSTVPEYIKRQQQQQQQQK